jgi:hypothetical protein
MKFSLKRITLATVLFFVFVSGQMFLPVTFAEPNANRANSASTPQQATGILTTQRNKPIAVNGNSAISGATIVSGTNIETPEDVNAKVDLGTLGWLDIAPKAELALTFDRNGNVKVLLSQGCVVLHTRKNTTGEIDTVDGMIGKSDPTKDDVLRVCSRRGAVPPANTGAAATGMSTKTGALIGLLGDAAMITAAILIPCHRGRNPSPGEPRGRNDECR